MQKIKQKNQGFVLFEAICCLSITIVVLMLVSIAFLQITNTEEEKLERLNSFSIALSEIKRLETWPNLPAVSDEKKDIVTSDQYSDFELVSVEENITIATKAIPYISIPDIKIESDFLKEDFSYEITTKETIRIHID